MIYRFYNGGHKFDVSLLFSNPNGPDIHAVGRRHFVFEKEEFTEIDDELQLGTNDAAETVRGNFGKDLLRNYGHRGLVMVDKKHDPETEDPEKLLVPKAPTDELAVLRGQQLWHDYTMEVVQHHLEDCESARAAGGAPRAARAFTKHCLKIHSIKDPAEQYLDALKGNGNGAALPSGIEALIVSMQQQQAADRALMHQLILSLAGKKVNPAEMEKLLSATMPGPSPTTVAHTSGIATGKTIPDKPLNRGYDTLANRPDEQQKQGIKLKGTGKAGRESAARKLLETVEAGS